jgi:hypothetical protein
VNGGVTLAETAEGQLSGTAPPTPWTLDPVPMEIAAARLWPAMGSLVDQYPAPHDAGGAATLGRVPFGKSRPSGSTSSR